MIEGTRCSEGNAVASLKPLSTSCYSSSSTLAKEALAVPKTDVLIGRCFAVASSVLKHETACLLIYFQQYQ